MTEFDAKKALSEQIAGLADVHKVIVTRAREAEQKFAEAEIDHNNFTKLAAFVLGLLDEKRAKLRKLQEENL
jgi:erythromycin esterase-like protein